MPVYYDISLPVSAEMPVWPGDPAIRIEQVSSARYNGFNISRLEMGTHTLTHMDAPRHVKDRGTPVDRLPLDLLIGQAADGTYGGTFGVLAIFFGFYLSFDGFEVDEPGFEDGLRYFFKSLVYLAIEFDFVVKECPYRGNFVLNIFRGNRN